MLKEIQAVSPPLPLGYLEEQRLLPVRLQEDQLLLAYAGTPDPQAVAELEEALGARAVLLEAPEEELLAAACRVYGGEPATAADLIARLRAPDGEEAVGSRGAHDLERLAGEAPVVRLVNLLLTEAVQAGASDLHLDATEAGLAARYRIDGVLQDAPAPPAHLRAAVVSRLKIMAELDTAERRLPQDGRIRLALEDRELDVRVSTLPTLHGESVVLRLLDARRQHHSLETLGMAPDTLRGVRDFSRRPQGVLLATGPTGSGKTTTLYAILEGLATGRTKIVSVEDPVEYELDYVSQVPVQPAAGLTFARALRAILRQDPDILLVGEMRDPETAGICTQAAMTGHLVFSTLHTTDAPAALTRLLDLGVPDYLVASTVQAVLAQRLVRRTCAACAEEAPTPEELRDRMAREGWEVPTIRRGRGCDACRGTGYHGRTGLYEFLIVDDDVRRAVLRHGGTVDIRRAAGERGLRPLQTDGWRQVAAGITTPEEVLRVTVA
ncbi:MAG TPA: GspE/PulE family protein [Gemmatimonadota bacterium]|nr:GspE/PulE family protein [Gemmatimonadota bacterium]